MEKFASSRRAVGAENACESGLDLLTEENWILNLRSIQAVRERQDDALVDWSTLVASHSRPNSHKDEEDGLGLTIDQK